MEDRYSAYSNRYYINGPEKSRRKEKYWIYLTISCMVLLLTGIVLLVVFLIPKHKLPYAGMNTKFWQAADAEEGTRFQQMTAIPPRHYPIDPRSDFPENENETQPEFNAFTSRTSSPATGSSTSRPMQTRGSSSPAWSPKQDVRSNDRFNKTFWDIGI